VNYDFVGWLYYVAPLLKVAAAIHAIRSGAVYYWIWIIVFVPFGELVYFGFQFAPQRSAGARFAAKKRGVRELRYSYEQNPSLQNEVALADRLAEAGEHAEASALYVRALGRDAQNLRARYGLGLCQIEAHDYASAVDNLRVVVDAGRGYEEYRAWRALARALSAQGRTDEAVSELEKMFAASPRLAHAVELGRALATAGRTDEARRLVERAIEDHEHAPRHVRRGSRPVVRKARELSSQLTRGGAPAS